MSVDLEKIIHDAIENEIDAITTKHHSEDEIMTAQQAVDYIGAGISYNTLMRECRKGNIPCFRIGSRVFIRKSKLLGWIESQEGGTA